MVELAVAMKAMDSPPMNTSNTHATTRVGRRRHRGDHHPEGDADPGQAVDVGLAPIGDDEPAADGSARHERGEQREGPGPAVKGVPGRGAEGSP